MVMLEKIVKYAHRYSLSWLIAILGFAMSLFTILLCIEYRYFKQQTEQMLLLKEDYQNHLMAVNKVLLDYNKTRERLELLESEKKN